MLFFWTLVTLPVGGFGGLLYLMYVVFKWMKRRDEPMTGIKEVHHYHYEKKD